MCCLLWVLQMNAQTQPNFIFITLDDCNDWVQGFNGHPQTQTPNIQFLEKKGTTFINAYAPAPQCAPSRTSFITGKDCDYTKIYHNSMLKCSSFRYNFNAAKGNAVIYTIPQILKDSGNYFTYSISKVMHCHDEQPDFDSLTADPCMRQLSWNKCIVFDPDHGDEEEVTTYGYAHELGLYEFPYSVIPDSMEHAMQDYKATDSAIAFIEDYAAHPEKYCNRPFFLALGYRRPHGPCYIPQKYFLSYHDTSYYAVPYDLPYDDPAGTPYSGVVMPPQPVPAWSDYSALPADGVAHALVDASPVHKAVFDWSNWMESNYGIPYIADGLSTTQRDYDLEESKRANMIMGYLAAIKFSDAQLGRLIDDLKTHPELYNNTVFVVLGDHGYSLGEKSHWKKGTLWETDVRAPLVITDLRSPAKKTCKRFVNFIDLFPTFCDLAGVNYPTFPDGSPYLDGFSLSPLLTNPNYPWDRPVLSSFKNGSDTTLQGACFVQYSVRDDEYHYIKYTTNGSTFPVSCDEATAETQEELYHIGKKKNIDPYEWDNLADDPAYTGVKDYLASYLPGGVNYLQFAKSNITATPESNSGDFIFNMYPNPADDYFNLCIEDLQPGDAEVHITDMSGRVISNEHLVASESGYVVTVYPAYTLAPGIYFITVLQQGVSVTQKLSVLR